MTSLYALSATKLVCHVANVFSLQLHPLLMLIALIDCYTPYCSRTIKITTQSLISSPFQSYVRKDIASEGSYLGHAPICMHRFCGVASFRGNFLRSRLAFDDFPLSAATNSCHLLFWTSCIVCMKGVAFWELRVCFLRLQVLHH